MNEAILKKLEARVDRRSFLRGSALAAATLVGLAAASPIVTVAQAQEKVPPQDDKKKDDAKKDQDEPKDDEKDAKPYRVEGSDGKFYDRQGVEVRECPECGHNTYQQGRTWTCENCGYSYVE
ncbi:MAG TPA: twin-arginine translocation signal domain-containing protein [Vicinamibacterales bacterium]|nr:twin-arginine translocation signal domain-containing protein [Vicinamibacterales bacterium]